MIKLTTEQFVEKAKLVHSDKYDYSLVNYVNAHSKIKIICPVHGVFEQAPNNHLNGQNCPFCEKEKEIKNKTKTAEQFINEAKLIHGNKYDYSLVNYIRGDVKVKIICPVHGEFEATPNNHLKNRGCPKCGNLNKGNYCLKNTEQFINEANKIHGNKYDYSQVDYINSQTKIKIICPIHGVFEQKPNSHLRGVGCPKCKSSHGETKIRNYLKENSILFEEQKRFKNCRDKLPLPFDFYLPKENLLIEYQGEQHYRRSENFWGGKVALKKQKYHDKLKKKFCKKNYIRLLTISYKENIIRKLEEEV